MPTITKPCACKSCTDYKRSQRDEWIVAASIAGILVAGGLILLMQVL